MRVGGGPCELWDSLHRMLRPPPHVSLAHCHLQAVFTPVQHCPYAPTRAGQQQLLPQQLAPLHAPVHQAAALLCPPSASMSPVVAVEEPGKRKQASSPVAPPAAKKQQPGNQNSFDAVDAEEWRSNLRWGANWAHGQGASPRGQPARRRCGPLPPAALQAHHPALWAARLCAPLLLQLLLLVPVRC